MWKGSVHKCELVFTVPGISYQNHRFELLFVGGRAEGHLGVDQVEAVLPAEDGVALLTEGARVAPL